MCDFSQPSRAAGGCHGRSSPRNASRYTAITQALEALGRSGVPVYALHRQGQAPILLSEVLNTTDVLAAFASASHKTTP